MLAMCNLFIYIMNVSAYKYMNTFINIIIMMIIIYLYLKDSEQ